MKLNKAGAILGAVALAFSLFPTGVLAAPGDRTAEESITVTGLDEGDTARYYQIVKYNTTTQNWELNGTYGTLTMANILDGITAEEAGIIAAAATTGAEDMTVATASGATTATANVDPGTYLVIVTPHENDTIYAPIFVSADFKENGNTIDASSESLPNPQVVVAKKSDLTVTKESTGSTKENESTASDGSVCVGSVIDFKVETNVPTYTTNVTNPTFKVSDKVSTGLVIKTDSLKVKVGTGSEQAVALNGYYNVDGSTASASDYDFTVTKLAAGEWEISFSTAYLTTQAQGGPKVTAVYKAEVTADAPTTNVNELKNTARIDYTHTPDGTQAYQEDDTEHYTYSFDMPIAGNTSSNSSEFKKVGINADGQTQYETFEVSTTAPASSSPLQGATFDLVAVTSGETYTSTASDTNGLFSFKGLDAGKYTLKEKHAPAGYILDPTTYYVEIIPVITDGKLVSYTVTCGANSNYQNSTVGSYTISNAGTGNVTAAKDATDPVAYFKNIETPTLPTTGGAGTLALTMGGVAMIAAGLVLVMRVTRKGENA